MPELVIIKPKKIKSEQYYLEALKGIMDVVINEEVVHLEISYKTRGDKGINSYTIGGASHLRDK